MFFMRKFGVSVVAWSLLAAVPAFGQVVDGFTLERPGDPYKKPDGGFGISGYVQRGRYRSIQVNTTPTGLNILGDAANEPSICVDPNRPAVMAIGWRQFDNIGSNFRQAGYAYSNTYGFKWTFPGVFTPGVFRSDPVLESDTFGNFYYNSLQQSFICDVFKSTDGGVNWTGPFSAFGGDKAWMTIDRTNSTGRNFIYCSWSTATGNQIFTRSTNGGTSWLTPIPIPNSPVFGTLDVGPNGEVYVVGINSPSFNNGTFVFTRSSNAKNSAVTPSFDLTRILNLGGNMIGGIDPNPVGLLGQCWIAVDRSGGPRNGWIYVLCSVDPAGADPMDVHLIRSTDGGSTWSAPIRVNDVQAGYQWFGTMSVAPNGRIDVVWLDTRSNPFGSFSELYTTYSLDGGTTWRTSVPAGPPFNHTLGYPNQNKMGDYFDMVSDNEGADLAYAATYNGEQDVYYLRLGLRLR